MQPLVVTSRVVVPPSAMKLAAARSGGPGGQNVNKVATKVELRVDLDLIEGLTGPELGRLVAIVRTRRDEDGRLVVTSQLTRSQAQNLEDVREKVREFVQRALVVPKRRVATKPTRASKARRLSDKRRNADKKERRRRAED